MKFSLPKTSRGWQNYQHLVGGLAPQLPVIAAFFVGTGNYWTAGSIVVLGFITQRASSEIAYQVQFNLIKEHTENKLGSR